MRQRGWHPTGFFGSVAAAAESCKLLELDLETSRRGLGIAASLGSGLSQNIGTMGMGLHAGNASRNGVLAAHLAREGFTADPRPLEGRFGLLDALCGPGGYDASILTRDLGRPFRLASPGITIKPYPNCWAHQKVLQAVLELVRRHRIVADQVESVLVDLQPDKPTYRYLEPKTDLEARYSLAYGIALALLDGELTLDQYEDERVNSGETHRTMAKVRHTPKATAAEQQDVTIVMKDGTRYQNRVEHSKGDPVNDPFTLEEVKEKYRLCAGRTLCAGKVERSMEMILDLENLSDLSSLIDLLIV